MVKVKKKTNFKKSVKQNGQNHKNGSILDTERSGTKLFGYFYIIQGTEVNHRKK